MSKSSKLILNQSSTIKPNLSESKTKRHLWLGSRKIDPELSFKIHSSSDVTIEEYLLEHPIFPVVLVWENIYGERKYATVSTK